MTSTILARSAFLAATGALLIPAGALASGPSVLAGPLKAKGYDVMLTGSGSSLTVLAAKTAGGSTQMHTWTFSGARVGARGIKASLGRYGKVDLTFSGGRAGRGSVPAGCIAGTASAGIATGTVGGDFAARFDSIGTQSLPAGATAMLMRG